MFLLRKRERDRDEDDDDGITKGEREMDDY